MDILYLDCVSGISGNMFLGALVDIGLDIELIKKELRKLPLEGYEIKISKTEKKGIACTYLDVDIDWNYFSEEKRKEQSFPKDIYRTLEESGLSPYVKKNAIEAFEKNILTKSKIFNVPENEIHFNSIELMDTYIDITGAAIAIEQLHPKKIQASTVHVGSGHFNSRHGTRIITDPIVLDLFQSRNIPIISTDIRGQLVTITGACILTQFVDEFCPMNFSVKNIGYGCGSSDFKIPNVLRIIEGEENLFKGKFN